MEKRERTAGARLIVAMSLFTFGRFKRRGHRLLEHFYPDNASRNPLARVLVAALLVISQLTSTLAPVYSQTSPPILSGSIAGQGTLSSGTFFVDYRLANTGSGFASNIRINQLSVRTLSGAGAVTYDSTLSPALPIAAGDLAAGAFTTIRLYFSFPSTVDALLHHRERHGSGFGRDDAELFDVAVHHSTLEQGASCERWAGSDGHYARCCRIERHGSRCCPYSQGTSAPLRPNSLKKP